MFAAYNFLQDFFNIKKKEKKSVGIARWSSHGGIWTNWNQADDVMWLSSYNNINMLKH